MRIQGGNEGGIIIISLEDSDRLTIFTPEGEVVAIEHTPADKDDDNRPATTETRFTRGMLPHDAIVGRKWMMDGMNGDADMIIRSQVSKQVVVVSPSYGQRLKEAREAAHWTLESIQHQLQIRDVEITKHVLADIEGENNVTLDSEQYEALDEILKVLETPTEGEVER